MIFQARINLQGHIKNEFFWFLAPMDNKQVQSEAVKKILHQLG